MPTWLGFAEGWSHYLLPAGSSLVFSPPAIWRRRRQQTIFFFLHFIYSWWSNQCTVSGVRKNKVEKLHFNSRQQHSLICITEQPSVKVSVLEVEFFILLVEDAGLRAPMRGKKQLLFPKSFTIKMSASTSILSVTWEWKQGYLYFSNSQKNVGQKNTPLQTQWINKVVIETEVSTICAGTQTYTDSWK